MAAVGLVERLTGLAEAQREAAIAFDVPRVDALTRERADVLFELQIVLRSGLPDDEKERVRERLPRLQRAERRLAGVVGAVANALRPAPVRASTYGRRGQIR